MQLSPELNDHALDPIFHWYGKQQINDVNNNTFDVYIRLVGDAELNRAKVFGLRKVAELKAKLKDETSDEYLGFISQIDELSKDELYNGVLYFKFQDLIKDASKTVKIKPPKEPSGDASIERQAEYQEELDNWPKKLEQAIQDFINPRYLKIKQDYANKTQEQLYSEYKKYLVSQYCELEFSNAFKDICTYFGTYRDEEFKEKFFNSLEEFQNLRSDVKDQFIQFYNDLEISHEELKK